MKSHWLLCIFFAALALSGCGEQPASSTDITGTWQLEEEGQPINRVTFFPDGRFHVDLLAQPGIEVDGRYELEGAKVTLRNTQGTDEAGSDPKPGIYEVQRDEETLRFRKISDPLERRSEMLTRTWQRVDDPEKTGT